jgi:anti-sigma regulatory factor (Ser/Thr protein kinase)
MSRPPRSGARPDPRAALATDPWRYRTSLRDGPAERARVLADVHALAERTGFADRAPDLVLAVDELIANATRHGAPPVDVEAWSDGRLVIEVRDRGSGFRAEGALPSRPPDTTAHGGRGLWIVRQLADLVEVFTGPEGTRVRMELTPEPQIGA